MTKTAPTDPMFKPEFEGERPKGTLSGPEKQQLRLVKAAVIDRLHRAMLTQCAVDGPEDLGLRAGGIPENLIEFSDLVGQERAEAEPARFRPTAADVTDMPKALALLDGLKKHFYTVVKMRALNEFAVEEGEEEPFPWSVIGEHYGFSGRWAESVYDAAIVLATRRAGLLPMTSRDFAVVGIAVWVDREGWLTNLGTAASPRAAVSNQRAKSPIPLTEAFAVWVPGEQVAKRVVAELRPRLRGLQDHNAWFKVNPETLKVDIIEKAREIGADWMLEELAVRGPDAEDVAA